MTTQNRFFLYQRWILKRCSSYVYPLKDPQISWNCLFKFDSFSLFVIFSKFFRSSVFFPRLHRLVSLWIPNKYYWKRDRCLFCQILNVHFRPYTVSKMAVVTSVLTLLMRIFLFLSAEGKKSAKLYCRPSRVNKEENSKIMHWTAPCIKFCDFR